MRRSLPFGFLLLVLVAVGCGPKKPSLTVPDSEIEGLSRPLQLRVEGAREAVADAESLEERREKALEQAERELEIAELEREVARATERIAQLRFEAAQESTSAERLLPARERLEQRKADLEWAKANLELQSSEVDYRKAQLKAANTAVYASRAKLELAKFEAVSEASGASGPDYTEELARFEKQVAKANLRQAEAKTAAARQKTRRDRARRKLADLDPPAGREAGPQPQAVDSAKSEESEASEY